MDTSWEDIIKPVLEKGGYGDMEVDDMRSVSETIPYGDSVIHFNGVMLRKKSFSIVSGYVFHNMTARLVTFKMKL